MSEAELQRMAREGASTLCQACGFTRHAGGLTSPMFFGPVPIMNPCEDCWAWKRQLDGEAELSRLRYTQADLNAAVAAEREACAKLCKDAGEWYLAAEEKSETRVQRAQNRERRNASYRLRKIILARGKWVK